MCAALCLWACSLLCDTWWVLLGGRGFLSSFIHTQLGTLFLEFQAMYLISYLPCIWKWLRKFLTLRKICGFATHWTSKSMRAKWNKMLLLHLEADFLQIVKDVWKQVQSRNAIDYWNVNTSFCCMSGCWNAHNKRGPSQEQLLGYGIHSPKKPDGPPPSYPSVIGQRPVFSGTLLSSKWGSQECYIYWIWRLLNVFLITFGKLFLRWLEV